MARLRSPEKRGVSGRVQRAFGKRLQTLRKGRRNQHQLADALDVSRTTISNIERGRHRVFLDQAYLAAHALGIPLADLLPTLDQAFPAVPVAYEKRSEVQHSSILRASEIVTTLQQQKAPERRARSPLRPTSTRRKR